MLPAHRKIETPATTGRRFAPLALAVLMAFAAAPVPAAEGIAWDAAGQESFKDLPGVKPQDPANQFGEDMTCETRTVSPRPGIGGRRELRDVLPYTVYRCEKNGIVYQGTQPPRTGRQWYPGVNPRVID